MSILRKASRSNAHFIVAYLIWSAGDILNTSAMRLV
jgi:hypothetical protein